MFAFPSPPPPYVGPDVPGDGEERVAFALGDVDPTPPLTGHIINLPLSQPLLDERVAIPAEENERVAAPEAAQPKRRRLTGKISPAAARARGIIVPDIAPADVPPPPPAVVPQPDHRPDPAAANVTWISEEQYLRLEIRARYRYIYEHIRGHYCRVGSEGDEEQVDEDGDVARVGKYKARRKLFGAFSSERKDFFGRSWIAAANPPAFLRDRALGMFQNAVKCFKPCKRQKQVMLTYSGPWVMKDVDGETLELVDVTVDQVVRMVRDSTDWTNLWIGFQRHCETLNSKFNANEFCACMELCTSTLQDAHAARTHFHCFFRSEQVLTELAVDDLLFHAVRPCNSNNITGVNSKLRNNWAGYFYIVVEKIGCIYWCGARRPFRDFTVRSEWIMNLLQCGKIKPDAARVLLSKVITGAPRHLRDIETCENMAEEAHVSAVLEAAERALASTRRAWRLNPQVDLWLGQYSRHAFRFNFLVLEGPSKMGKTQYAKGLAPSPDSILEVNCSTTAEPDLKAFKHAKHSFILFDEIQPSVVLRQRKLFQASPCMVELGSSTTNCHSYRRCFYQVRMILSTNVWSELFPSLSEGDRSWLDENSVVIQVRSPLWESTPDGAARDGERFASDPGPETAS